MDDIDYLDELDKKYYKIRDVSALLDVAPSTLRYWESEFPEIQPRRSNSNQRYYRPEDIKVLRMIHYLVKVKGLRIEAAKEELSKNRTNVSRRLEVIELLTDTRDELQEILSALNKRRWPTVVRPKEALTPSSRPPDRLSTHMGGRWCPSWRSRMYAPANSSRHIASRLFRDARPPSPNEPPPEI